MKIDIKFDTRQLATTSLREQKRLAYNTAQSINNTGKVAQQKIRDHITQVMRLRSSTKRDRKFILEQIKLSFASVKKGQVYCELYIAPKARLLLGAFETGEDREGFVGKNVAIPNPELARVGGQFSGGIRKDQTFKALKLKPVRVTPRTKTDTEQFKGANRSFGLKSTSKHPLGGVYERVGPGRDDIRLVYSFHQSFKLHEILHFVDIAAATMRDQYAIEWVIANARTPSPK
jgi:hypothetical protein